MTRIVKLCDRHIFDYIKSLVGEIDSVVCIPEDELRSNEKYPDMLYTSQHKVLLKFSHPYDGINKLCENTPQNLWDILQLVPYRQEENNTLLVIAYLHSDFINTQRECIDLHTGATENTSDVVAATIDDFKYINQYSDLITTKSMRKESVKVQLTDSLVPTISEYNTVGLESITKYVNELNIQITNIEYNGSEFVLCLTRSDLDRFTKYSRNIFLKQYTHIFRFSCPDCNEKSIGVSDKMVGYCSSCTNVFTVVDPTAIPASKSVRDLRENPITEYTTTQFNSLSQRKFHIPDDVNNIQSENQIHIARYDSLILYLPLENSNLWVPVDPRTKQLHTDSVELENGTCYTCSQSTELTHKLPKTHIYTGYIAYWDSIYICDSCQKDISSSVKQQINNNPELDSKIVSQNL